MYRLLTPALRADVVVRPFDAADGDCRFVVAVDDRHFVVTAAVAAVLEASRHSGTFESLAERASGRLGAPLSASQVARLMREQVPAVLFQPLQGESPRASTERVPLWFRRRIVHRAALAPILAWAAHLFDRHIALALATLFIAVDALVAMRGFGTPPPHPTPLDTAVALGLLITGVFVHELGHLAACARYGAPHGSIGLGLYWGFPTFYAEVHGAWLLARRERAIVDAGGLYLQALYVLALGALYLACGAPPLLSAIAWSHALMLHTLNPVLKFDGYWLLTDLTGTQNLHRRVRLAARQALRALRRMRASDLPSSVDLTLLGVFLSTALIYFTYVLAMLGHSLAAAMADVAASRSALQALAHGTQFALWLAMAAGLALLLARSLATLAGEQSHDR